MTPLFLSFDLSDEIDGLKSHIEDLTRQMCCLERIERLSGGRLDFADFIETHALLKEEIERLQFYLRGEDCETSWGKEVEEEEEEVASPSKYDIEHLVRGDDGKLRRLTSDDVFIGNNSGVRNAFLFLYEAMRDKYSSDDVSAGMKRDKEILYLLGGKRKG